MGAGAGVAGAASVGGAGAGLSIDADPIFGSSATPTGDDDVGLLLDGVPGPVPWPACAFGSGASVSVGICGNVPVLALCDTVVLYSSRPSGTCCCGGCNLPGVAGAVTGGR